MEKNSRRRSIVENGWFRLSTAVLVGSLTLMGCARAGESDSDAPSNAPTLATTTAHPGVLPKLVFDDLHGGSPLIQVYPGVTESAADKQPNGTFNDGDSVTAECKTEGRDVHSDINAGESDRSSDEWVRIQGSPGETQYATAVYVENPSELLAQLPNC
jgi:hypothetical protein